MPKSESNVVVRLKPGHPTGTYRRGGYVFTAGTDVLIPAGDLPDAIRDDPWLLTRGEDEPFSVRRQLPTEEPGDPARAPELPDYSALQHELTTTKEALDKRTDELKEANDRIAVLEGKKVAEPAKDPAPLFCILEDCPDRKTHAGFKGFDDLEALNGHAMQAHNQQAELDGDDVVYRAKVV